MLLCKIVNSTVFRAVPSSIRGIQNRKIEIRNLELLILKKRIKIIQIIQTLVAVIGGSEG